ncbi:MAG: TolC family protein [Bacteroidetes bacterium]|nr:TolC family protein [Bacteroidota bacterium]MBU1580082.1 TolC family protein [Bacteroidota bacterium]MBU2466559.1 TolC family protein [Bacteroidota bacterium]MBU2556291.1 TolC family protein [Bacteroidota bacterium]
MKTKQFYLLIWLSWPLLALSQPLLTEADAVRIGLENNYNIRLVKKEVAIAENNNSLGSAGFLPEIALTAGQNYSINDSKQEFLTGQVNDRKGARSDAFSAAAQLNWTLFDGLQMFRRYDILNTMQQQSELELLLAVENNVYNILANYYSLVQINLQLDVVKTTIEVDHERVALAGQMLEIGAGSRLELLQAEVDRNADSALFLDLNDRIAQLKTVVNDLLGRDPGVEFKVADSFAIQENLIREILLQKMLENNTSLMLSAQDEKLAQLSLKEIRGRQAPELDFNLGYTFNDQNSEAGFLKTSQTNGITYGLSARMNLFNGFSVRRDKQNAHIMLESSQLRIASLENSLKAELYQQFEAYTNSMHLLRMESQNVLAARENLEIASERYQLGDLSGIEFREAQRNFMAAESRLLSARLQVKISEISLRQLAGELALE